MPRSTDHARGLAIAAAGGLALTVDIPLIRLADGNHWSVLLLRSGTTFCATLALWYCWRRFAGSAPRLLPGLPGLWVACLYGLASVAFMAAVYHTSTANLVFILALNTMFSGLLSWLFLKERPRAATMIAMAFMIVASRSSCGTRPPPVTCSAIFWR